MRVYLSKSLWDHLPSLAELRATLNPERDQELKAGYDSSNVDKILELTGLKIFYNSSSTYFSEIKYYTDDAGEIILPAYSEPTDGDLILN